jgi:hypothetical protein
MPGEAFDWFKWGSHLIVTYSTVSFSPYEIRSTPVLIYFYSPFGGGFGGGTVSGLVVCPVETLRKKYIYIIINNNFTKIFEM